MRPVQIGRRYQLPTLGLLLGLLLAAVGLLVLPSSVQAADPYAHILIDEGGSVRGKSSTGFEISGGVTFIMGEVTIQADELTLAMDDGTPERAEFRGNVQVERGGQAFAGDSYVFDVPSNTSYMLNARGSLEAERSTEPILFTAAVMRDEGGSLILEEGRFTTCSCTEKGYYLSASRMEIHPGDRVVLHSVRFVDFGITLFYWPRLTIPMDDPGFLGRILPRIGYNANDGWSLRYNHAYGLGRFGEGVLHFDWVQRRGFGLGATHTYRQNDAGKGELLAYALYRPGDGLADALLGWSERYTSDALDLSVNVDWEQEGPLGQGGSLLYGDVSLLVRSFLGTSRLEMEGDRKVDGGIVDEEMLRTRITHTTQLADDRVQLDLEGDAFHRAMADDTDRYFGYSAALRGRVGAFDWSLRADQQFNEELTRRSSSSTNPSWLTTGRMPEFTLSTRPTTSLFGLNVPLRFEGSIGRYSEVRSAGDALLKQQLGRATLLAGVQNLRLPIGERFTLTWSGSLQGYHYEGGLNRLVANSDLRGTLRVTDALTLNTRYQYRNPFGPESPFRFDRVTATERVTGTLNYRTSGLNLSLSGGYNLLTERPNNLSASIEAGPWLHTSIRLQGTYSLVNRAFQTATGTIQFEPNESLALRLGGQYNFNRNGFNRIDTSVHWSISDWTIGYQASYNPLDDRLTRGELSIMRILDECRELGLSWDQAKETIWLEYRIFAFPDAGLRVGSEGGGLMFDIEGWEELVGG